jgi:Fe-S cluster assembly protein SufD
MTGSDIKAQDQDVFQGLLENLYTSMGEDDPLFRFRSRAWDQFLELGLPNKKTGEFQYLPLRKLYGRTFSLPSLGKTAMPVTVDDCTAVFLNGRFDPELSNLSALPKKAMAIPLYEAFRAFGSFLNNQSIRSLQEETDAFAALNGAFASESLFVYLPPQAVLETPLKILHIVDQDGVLFSPRVEVFCGALSQANLSYQTVYAKNVNSFVNGAIHISLEEGASVLLERKGIDVPESAWEMQAIRASLKRDSVFNTLSSTIGGETLRDDYKLSMLGTNAEAHLTGCWMLEGKREAHTHVKIDHQAPNCRSNQLFKGVLNGYSKSSFEGKIYIHKEAQKTEAFQMNQNLLLSQGAQANTKPNLEIFADDVKASHGATVGQINEDELFYLQARGLSKEESKQLLIKGFCAEVMDRYVLIK